MTAHSRIVSIIERTPESHSRLKELEALLNLSGPPDRFLAELLGSQCRIAAANGGVLLRIGDDNQLDILAIYPAQQTDRKNLEWITRTRELAGSVISSGETVVAPEGANQPGGGNAQRWLILIPVKDEKTVRAIAAFVASHRDPAELATCRERLEMTPLLLNHYELRQMLNLRQTTVQRMRQVIEMLDVVNRPDHFLSTAMALCNEIASRMHCSRVSLGMLHNRHVRVQAISHTDRFRREMQLVRDIEAAMEECLDQDLEVIYPAADNAVYASRVTAKLSINHGTAAVLSLPIRHNGEAFAVLTLERPVKRPFNTLDQIEAVRLLCDLCAPGLFRMYDQDRWVGARLALRARKYVARLLGPEHTWMKAGILTAVVMVIYLTYARGNYRIDAPFKFEAPLQQAVVAPFDTYLRDVSVDPGDEVSAGQNVLGLLDTSELRLELAALQAEYLGHRKQMTASMRDGKTAEAQIAEAQGEKVAAEIRLLELKIEKARLVAPITGRIVSEDLKRQIGAPVETGKILFEIARIESLRAELYVPEENIASVKVGQTGEMASVGHPDRKIRFVVERINPIADVVHSKNVFRVRARLHDQFEWMRPGMEGIAKIDVGEKSFIWIGTHRIVNWLRMKLWF